MEAVNTVLTALATALTSGSQAVLNDTAKDALTCLKQHLVKAFSGQQKSLMVLDEFQHDPDTWEKPLRDALIKAGLSQDEATLKAAQRLLDLLPPQTKMRDHISIHHHGQSHGSIYGNNYGTVQVSAHEDKIANGNAALLRGRNALWRGEYSIAKHHLEEASHLLPEDQFPAKSAQVRFLQALVLLNGKRPFSARYQILCSIEQLLQAAIALHGARSYFYTLALIKQDYSRNGFPSLMKEAQALIHQMMNVPSSPQDQENIELLARCQPRLVHDAQDIRQLFAEAG